MVYLSETELPKNKSVYFALNQIYGLGKNKSFKICKKLGLCINYKVKNLLPEQVILLTKILESFKLQLSSDLRKKNSIILKNLTSLKTYRGLRLVKGLPVRGQRTHTNAKSAKRRKNF